MTDYNDKLRSLFLAAIMVVSVFGGTVALTGNAAAQQANSAPTIESAVEYGGSGTIEVSFNTEVEQTDGTALEASDFTITVDGTDVTPSSITESPDGDQDSWELSHNQGNLDPVQDVKVDVGTIQAQGYSGQEADPEETDVQVTASDIAVDGAFYSGTDGPATNAKLVYPGEPLNIQYNSTEGGSVKIYKQSTNNLVRNVGTDDRGAHLSFDTGSLDSGATYRVVFTDDGTSPNTQYFNTTGLDFSASAQDTSVQTDDYIKVDVSAISQDRPVYAELVDSDDDVDATATGSLGNNAETTLNLSTAPDADTYTVTVYDNRTGISAETAEINVSEAPDGEVSFDADGGIVEDDLGDTASIPISLQGNDKATVAIGDLEDGYSRVVQVTDDSGDGEVTLEFNSYLAGSQGSDVVTVADEDDSKTIVDHKGFSGSNGGLDSGTYSINATLGHESSYGFDDSAVATMRLRSRSTDNVNTWVAPSGASYNDWGSTAIVNGVGSNITETDGIVKDDHMVLQIEASGLEGALSTQGADEEDALFNQADLFHLTLEQQNPGQNDNAKTLSVDDSNTNVVMDADNDTYYVVTDTSGLSANSGEEYEANFTVDPNNELSTDNNTETDTFSFVSSSVSLDTNAEGEVIVSAADDQHVNGTTNIAPGSEVRVRVESADESTPFLIEPTTDVQADGSFGISGDFSSLATGTNLTVEVTQPSSIQDDWDGRVAAPPEASVSINDQNTNGFQVTVSSVSMSRGGFVALHSGSASGDIIGTSNYLSAGDYSDLTITVDSEITESMTIVAMPHQDADGSGGFAAANDPAYMNNDSAVTDSASVSLRTPTATATETPTPTATETATPTETEMGPTATETTGDSGPGFTPAIALVAVIAAALLALRRRD